MFKVYDGRKSFYQWDLNQKLIVSDPNIAEVHFCNQTDECSLVCEVYEEAGQRLVNVPNILLQDIWPIRTYAICDCATTSDTIFDIKPRSKPADYVYTETEVRNWEEIVKRLSEIEVAAGGIVDVDELPTVDISAKAIYRLPNGRLNYYCGEWLIISTNKEISALEKEIISLDSIKQDNLSFDGDYNAETNKVATVQTVINRVAEIINGAPEDFDTLKELADWLTSHGRDVAQMNSAIAQANKTAAEAKTTADTLNNTIQTAFSHSTETRDKLSEEVVRAKEAEQKNATAIEGLATSKQDTLSFDGVYNKDTNKAATVETVTRLIAEIIAGADSDFDTLKELADWLATHGAQAAEMNSAIKTNTDNIAKNIQDIKANADAIKAEKIRAETVEGDLAKAVDTANVYAQTAISNATATLTTANEAKVLASEANEISKETQKKEQSLEEDLDAYKKQIDALLESDDTTLDQLQEIVDYIKNNKDLIDGITTNKVNVSDIINNLLSSATDKPLSANQGKVLKGLIDALAQSLGSLATKSSVEKTDIADGVIPAALSDLSEDSTHRTVTDAEKSTWSGKQDRLVFEDEYNVETNKVATLATVTKKIAEIIANAPEDFDTLKELADWLETHGAEAAQMNSAIKANSEAIENISSQLEGGVGGVQSDYSENDRESKAHILNRPFYEEVENTVYNRTPEIEGVTISGYKDAYLVTPNAIAEEEIANCSVTVSASDGSTATIPLSRFTKDISVEVEPSGEYTYAIDCILYENSSFLGARVLIVYRYNYVQHFWGASEVTSNGVYLCESSLGNFDVSVNSITIPKYTIHTLPNKFLDLSDNEDLQKKQDKLVNDTGYEAIPVIRRNSSDIQNTLATQGVGLNSIPIRTDKGALRANTVTDGLDEDTAKQVLVNLGYLNPLLENVKSTIEGIDIPILAMAKVFTLTANKSSDFGLYVINGENVQLSYYRQEDGQPVSTNITSDFHILVIDKVKDYTDTTGSTIVVRILHIYQTKTLGVTTISSKDYALNSESSIFVTNNSTGFGARVHKIALTPSFNTFPITT